MSDPLKEVAEDCFNKIGGSQTFLSIFSESYMKDPVCLIQLAQAILMDKPIYLLVVKGAKIPRHLLRIMDGHEICQSEDPKHVEEASNKLIEKIRKAGLLDD